jgi:hypothetical protein
MKRAPSVAYCDARMRVLILRLARDAAELKELRVKRERARLRTQRDAKRSQRARKLPMPVLPHGELQP